MKYGNYIIEFSKVGNTDLDHKDDVLCKIHLQRHDGTPEVEAQNDFIITGGEIYDYGSTEAAIMAYMRREYPINDTLDILDYRLLQKRQMELHWRIKRFVEHLLARHGGCITSYPVPDEYGGTDYPATMVFNGPKGTQDVNITTLYLDADGRLKANGIDDRDGTIEKNLECRTFCGSPRIPCLRSRDQIVKLQLSKF